MSDFEEVAARQRACRAFSDEPVPDEMVERCLIAATFAPSAENAQPWELVVVRDAERRAAIGELVQQAWEGGGRAWAADRLDQALFEDVDGGARGGVAQAPVLVVVGVDTAKIPPTATGSSIFPAVQNLLLAATALGLGSALTTLATYAGDQLAQLVAFPPNVRPVAVVPLGWPARPLGPPRRDPFATRTHREAFGTAW